jgi:hypothetical protein
MSDLKNRVRYTNSVDIEILETFKEISTNTKIPQSKLLDEAILDLITKYGLKKSTEK